MSFWDSIKDTAESLGGAAIAPVGAVLDIAQMPFDNKDDNFGTITGALARRTADVLDPVINPSTISGGALSAALNGMDWLWREGVSEPAATTNMVNRHVFGGYGNLGPVGMLAATLTGNAHWGDAFDADTWAAAYKRANQQRNSLGAAFAYGALNPLSDPLKEANPYQSAVREHGTLATSLGWGGEFAGMMAGDPTWLALKGAGLARGTIQYGRLSAAQKGSFYEDLVSGAKAGGLKPNLQTRTDKWLDWISGQNSVNRPLMAPEIFHGTPELRRYAKDPEAVAGFLAEANKIENVAERRDVQRRILAVAAGDNSQVARIRAENADAATLADQLSNMQRGSTIDLDALGVAPTLANNPIFRLRLEGQLANLDNDGSVTKFFDDFIAHNERLLETQKSLPNAPGVHLQGKRAVNRLNDQGLARAPKNTLGNWAATLAQKAESTSSVYQRGKYTVPLVAVRTVGLASSPWTKAPIAISDALRQTHFNGVVSLHDWGTATNQLDSMMRLGEVSHGERMTLLSKAYLAKTEAEKQTIIEQVEKSAVRSLTKWAGDRSGHAVDDDYISTLLQRGSEKRRGTLASLQGRVYASTEAPEDLAMRMGGARAAEDAAARQAGGWSTKAKGNWRLDQINDDGTPLALPVFETQLGNYVPLVDMNRARTLVKRDTSYLSRISRTWKSEALELERLSGLKAAGATGLDKAIAARAASMDWLVDAGQLSLRAWKFSVLFRLGYPMRVLTDDHLRIWSKIGAGSFYGPNLRELGGNLKFNQFDRKIQARLGLRDLKVRRQQILDELDGGEMAVHANRVDDLKSVQASLRASKSSVSRLRKRVAEAETKHSLGLDVGDLRLMREKLKAAEARVTDREAAEAGLLERLGQYGPNELKRELGDIEERISLGTKALREQRRRIGSADITMADGQKLPGAFAGEYGDIMRAASSSGHTYESLLEGAESRSYRAVSGGSHSTLQPTEAGHLDAWADALNNQIGMSEVGRYFLEGHSVEDFTHWIKRPEQAALRRRVAHFAHDPEDWGHRAWGIVRDYVPTDEVRRALLEGRVSPQKLAKMVSINERPAVHGRIAMDNLGTSHAVQSVSKALTRAFRVIGETPTDLLSRHPYFNSLYRQHATDFYNVRKAAGVTRFTEQDAQEIALLARKAALKDLKSTLFDLSAHSHAAHVLRFISPFFGAHQEGVMRWWRIAADKPEIARRLTQFMDAPRGLGLVVDENGDLVPPGAPLSTKHRFLLQLPQAFGGPDPEKVQSKWTINENAFNIILQGGLTNPGTGPLVTVPMDYLAQTYADDPSIARVARIFNPYPANSPIENAFPAWGKRLSAAIYGETGVDPSFGLGIGKREYNDAFAQNLQDRMVEFQLENGREPTKTESQKIMEEVGAESTSQMWHRLMWNLATPTPASPRSKYAVFQQGWFKIQEQARAEGKDFDWAYEQFKSKYGAAYLPLIFSPSNNPGWVDANPASVAAIKHYKGILKGVDPALTRMVIGPYAEEMIDKNVTLGEYSSDARNFLQSERITPTDSQTYYSTDEPAAAMNEQMARRGWQKYGELTASLTALAQQQGLNSYEDSDVLVELKRKGVEAIRAENFAFDQEYGVVDSTKYERLLSDMRRIAVAPALADDAARPDIQVLKAYLTLHDLFAAALQRRLDAGLGGPDAESSIPMRQAYTALVDKLVESNTYFEQYIYNGTVDRDPLLYREAA